jgi:hypothetical protein
MHLMLPQGFLLPARGPCVAVYFTSGTAMREPWQISMVDFPARMRQYFGFPSPGELLKAPNQP